MTARPRQRRLTWPRLLARHLRLSAARWGVLALVVLITSLAAMAWPRWLERSASEELREALGSSGFVDPVAAPSNMWIDVFSSASDEAEAEQGAWGEIALTMDWALDERGPTLPGILGDPGMYAVVTGQIPVPIPEGSQVAGMSLRGFTTPGLLEKVAVVEGSLPEYRPITPEAIVPIEGEPGFEEFTPPPIELALSQEAAQALAWPVGEVRTVGTRHPWTQDLLLTGTYRATERAEESGWARQADRLLHPTISYSMYQDVFIEARAYVPLGAPMLLLWDTALGEGDMPEVRLWYPLDAGSLTMHEAPAVARDLRNLLAVPIEFRGGLASFSSSAPEVIESVVARQQATNAVLGLAVAAPTGVLLVLLALAATVIVRPRQAALGLLADRGASPAQVRALLGTEAALVSVPAAALGALAAIAALPAHASPWWWAAPAVIASAPIAALALGGPARPRPRLRLVVEAALLLLTVGATVALLTSDRIGASLAASSPSGGPDPLALFTPLLLAICVALGCVRLLGPLLRPVAARLRRRADLVAPLGATLSARQRPPLASTIAIVTGTAVAVLGQVASATISLGLHESARVAIGADVRISTSLPPDDVAWLADLAGVADVATIVTPYTAATVIADDGDTATFTLYAVDPAALARVQADVPGAIAVPAHSPGAPAGLILSDQTGLPPGTTGEMVVRERLGVEVSALGTRAPGLANVGVWGAVDVAALREAGSDLPPGSALLSLTPDDPTSTARVVADLRDHFGPRASVSSYHERVAELSHTPTARALRTGLALVSGLGVACAVVAVLLTLAGASATRARLVSVLRTLGLPPRAEIRLVAWEIAPAAGLALVAGGGLGLGLGALLVRVTDLRPFTGAREQPGLVLESLGLTLTLGGAALAVLLAVAIAAWAAGRRSAAVVLRVGEGSS